MFLAISLIAYGVSRKETRLVGFAPLPLIGGIMLLFIAAGWKWGLVGLIASLLIGIIVSIIPSLLGSPGHAGHDSPSLVKSAKEVRIIVEQHKMEIDDFWDSTSPDEIAGLMVNFLDELRLNWAREFPQLNPERLPNVTSENLRNSIQLAYITGYMMGKGWISKEQMANLNLYLGDEMARNLRLVFKGVKSRGIAFASSFTAVATKGYLAALGQ
ncbi:hypothetical protein ACFLWK_00835 [Chloroflexota bacterium]